MSDKRKVQLDLAKKLSNLISKLKNDKILQFLKAYFATIEREWHGIDRLRLDKFYSLSRCMIKEILLIAQKNSKLFPKILKLLNNGPLNVTSSKLPKGLLYHTSEAIIDEMIDAKVYNLELVEIFCQLLTRVKDMTFYVKLLEDVFEKIFAGKV